jgi:Cysteine-rich CPCC
MRYTCPCCGYKVFSGPPGTEETCPVCGWRDDLMHLRFPLFAGRPNGISLADAQVNYAMTGFPARQYERDPEWRAIDRDVDDLADVPVDFDALAEPEDFTSLYYWLPSYWQRVP